MSLVKCFVFVNVINILKKECNKLRTMFSKLHYPKRLVDSNINKFSQEPDKEIHLLPSADPSVYMVLPLTDQRSADRVRRDIYSLGAKIDVNVKPIFASKKLSQTLSVKENKPPIVNTQCVVYLFQLTLLPPAIPLEIPIKFHTFLKIFGLT